jgi:uncharacterized ferritin-like protein (DUF455 family)
MSPHLDEPKRSPFTIEGPAALLHAVTHKDFDASNLSIGTKRYMWGQNLKQTLHIVFSRKIS